MSQNFAGANITSGNGGAGGGRGGDIGSHNRWDSSTRNSHNDNSVHRHVSGNNYEGAVDQGDKFNGPISSSIVGGRGNSNSVTNHGSSSPGSQSQGKSLVEMEADIDRRLAQMKERLAAKKERERLRKKEEELKRLEAELGSDTE